MWWGNGGTKAVTLRWANVSAMGGEKVKAAVPGGKE